MKIVLYLGIIVIALAILCAFTKAHGRRQEGVTLSPAMDAYARGEFNLAETEANRLLESEPDAARHVLFLVAHASGRHERAVRLFGEIGRSYQERKELVEPACWSLIRLGLFRDARILLDEEGPRADRALLTLLFRQEENPVRAEISDIAVIPFVDDPLTPFLPGVAARLGGIDCVARIDTGGSWIHITAAFAKKTGIKTLVSERGFASLASDTLKYGITDIELGGVMIRNAPVCVHERGLSAEPIAAAFAVEMGPIIGTNVLALFYPTIDGPGKRLVLSPRGDEASRARHDALFPSKGESVSFILWADHYMIVPVAIGADLRSLSFVDSGLVVVTEEQGQASMLFPETTLRRWGGTVPAPGKLATLPATLSVGSREEPGSTAYVMDLRGWNAFGEWGGLAVDSLVSWGYLKHFAWSIDFDAYQYTLR